MTPTKEKPNRNHMIKTNGEKSSAVRKGSQTLSTTSENITFNTPTFVCVTPNVKKNELGQRCVSTYAAAGSHPGGNGVGGGPLRP